MIFCKWQSYLSLPCKGLSPSHNKIQIVISELKSKWIIGPYMISLSLGRSLIWLTFQLFSHFLCSGNLAFFSMPLKYQIPFCLMFLVLCVPAPKILFLQDLCMVITWLQKNLCLNFISSETGQLKKQSV